MRYFKTSLFLSATIALSGCGTIIEGQTQKVRLETPGAYEAECTMDNGVRYIAQNGETFTIQRSRKPLEIDCYGSGNRHVTKTVESTLNPWSAGNVTNGVAPGGSYDLMSGGLWTYPDVITVDFVGVPTKGFELPDYHNKDAPNPYKQPIEDYGPTTPRIANDSAYMRRDVEKRDAASGTNPFAAPKAEPAAPAPAPAVTGSSDRSGLSGSPGMMPMPVLKGGSAEELTRSANPTVFRK